MKNSFNLLTVVFIGLLLIVGCASKPTQNQIDAKKSDAGIFAKSNQSNIENQIRGRLGKFPEKWANIEISKFEPNAVTLYLNYARMPGNIVEVEADTKRVAQAALDVLVAQQYDPQKEWLALFVHAQRKERGATGSNNIRQFGKAAYDFNNDTLNFTGAK